MNRLFSKLDKYNVVLLGPDHLQLTLLNWHTENILALNKKLKVAIHFQVRKHFQYPNFFAQFHKIRPLIHYKHFPITESRKVNNCIANE